MKLHSFDYVLHRLKEGGKASRQAWKNVLWISIQNPDDQSKMTLPYIYTKTAAGDLVPWLASQTDILADDWVVDE